jgi:SAM-dependent methyltransferase
VDLSADPPAAWSRRFDLIICADVIEHLVDPDVVLRWIRLFSKPTSRIVLSTPERDLRRGRRSLGPPENLGHVREWNSREFCAYLDSRGFDILQHEIVDLKRGVKTCQLALLAP